MATLNIVELDSAKPGALFCRYDSEHHAQPCYLALDLEDGEFTADYNGEPGGNGMPMPVFHGRTRWYKIPPLTAEAANRLLGELAPLAQQVLDGSAIEWNGHNHVGRLDDDAHQAEEEIIERCDPENGQWDPRELVEEYPADEWWQDDSDRQALCAEQNITADTTDTELDAIAERLTEEAQHVGNSGYTILTGVERLLYDLRQDLRDQVGDELETTAETLRAAVDKRNALIRRMGAWRDDRFSNRGIAAIAGLSHVRVATIIRQEAPDAL